MITGAHTSESGMDGMDHPIDDELRILRERIEDLERRLESRVQDSADASTARPDVCRLIKFPYTGLGGGQTASVDWLAATGWKTGKEQISVVYRGPSATTAGQGTDPRTGDRRTGYAAWCQATGTWDVLQEFC